MAVPKKRISKTKKTIRRNNWKNKAGLWKKKALSIGLKLLIQPLST